jgi:pantoate--beta-alanine ligase
MQEICLELKTGRKTIGFIPTMGYLHNGHLSLIQKSKKENDITIVSIFVNPAQFAPNEDFTKYPRNTQRDYDLLMQTETDFLFTPDISEIYPEGFQTYIDVTGITKKQEGEFRPDHFKGVTTIVGLLFNIVLPDKAYFGQKDAQQCAVIKRMVKDLKYHTDIIICPIVREADGLAMSSRNVYLTPEERNKALILSRSLSQAEQLIKEGDLSTSSIIKKINRNFLEEKSIQLNYIRIVESELFVETEKLIRGKSYFILIACRIGQTRLIDNLFITIE